MPYSTDVTMARCEDCGDWVQRADAIPTATGHQCRSCEDPIRAAARVQRIEDMRRAMGRAA